MFEIWADELKRTREAASEAAEHIAQAQNELAKTGTRDFHLVDCALANARAALARVDGTDRCPHSSGPGFCDLC